MKKEEIERMLREESGNTGYIELQVKEWEDMLDEFGWDGDSIKVRHYFIPDMRPLCGKVIKVIGMDCEGDYVVVNPAEGITWIISSEMLKPIEFDENTYVENEQLNMFIDSLYAGGCDGCMDAD